MSCNKCKQTQCCCSSSAIARYTGPDIPELGIKTGDLIEVVIQNITNYITEGLAASTLVNNADGTYTHTPGDGTATSTTFVTGQHTTGLVPHTSPKYGDTWYDTTTGQLRWYTNNGTSDVWEVATAAVPARFKEETIHHSAGTTLTIDPSIHSKREIHFEALGDLLLDGNDHLALDDYTYLVVNTTAVDRVVTFANVTGAWLRDGGAITNLSGVGFTIPPNTSLLITVTNSGGNVYVNGHFYTLALAGDAINLFTTTVNLPPLTPVVVNVPTMANMESILILSDIGEDITDGVLVTVAGSNITITSNVDLEDVQIRVIYSV